MKDTKSYQSGHPNPRFYRPSWRTLNGSWSFVFDDENIGVKEAYFNRFPQQHLTINVPYAYESPRSGIDDKSEHNILWYRTSFSHHSSEKTLLLHIEKSDYLTTVYLNGYLVGEHQGGYDAFSLVLTPFVKEGLNDLVIRMYDSKDARQLRGKQTWKETPFECFYHGTSGIYGDVWLEEVDPSYVKHVELFPSFSSKSILTKMDFSVESIGKSVEIAVYFNETLLAKKQMLVSKTTEQMTLELPEPLHLWRVDQPQLYDVEIKLDSNGILCDKVLTYFGINSPSIDGKNICFNGTPLFLKLVLDQGYFHQGDLTGTEADYLVDISYLKKAGFNGVRKHEKIESNLFFYLADREGLLNWLELPSPHLFDEMESNNIANQWERIVRQHLSSPSLMAYVCYNESWGVHQIKNDEKQQKFATRLYYEIKQIDPNRFVISNDGWEHTISDLLTVHNYQESKEDLLKTYAPMMENLRTLGNSAANETRMCYADGYRYRNEPIVLSEFAGIALDTNTNEGWGYGKAAIGVDGFAKKLQGQIEAIYESGNFSGYCITQLTDVYQEKNGLLTQDRQIKISPEILRKII